MSSQFSLFITLENFRRPEVFSRLQGMWKLINFKNKEAEVGNLICNNLSPDSYNVFLLKETIVAIFFFRNFAMPQAMIHLLSTQNFPKN